MTVLPAFKMVAKGVEPFLGLLWPLSKHSRDRSGSNHWFAIISCDSLSQIYLSQRAAVMMKWKRGE